MNDVRKYCLWDVQIIVNKLNFTEWLGLIKYMCAEYQLIEITNYCKKYKLNDKTLRNRINNGKIPCIEISKTIFIIEKLIV